MDITITANGYRPIDNDSQVTFFTLAANGATYKWHGNTPRLDGDALQAHLESHREEYLSGIYRKMYQEAEIDPAPGETELEAWLRWIAGGCRNVRQVVTEGESGPVMETVEEVILLTPWKDSHPIQETITWV